MLTSRFAPYSLRSLRAKPGRDVTGYTATLYRGEMMVATLDADSAGDDTILMEFISDGEQQAFVGHAGHAMSTTDRALSNFVDAASAEELVDADEAMLRLMAEATYQQQRLSKICEDTTLFRLPGDAGGAWRRVDAPYRQALGVALRRKYSQVEILNEAQVA